MGFIDRLLISILISLVAVQMLMCVLSLRKIADNIQPINLTELAHRVSALELAQ
jgi:hypothetical protein